jgi:hypothetical protein
MESLVSEMRRALEREAFREKGCKRHGIFGGHYGHTKGMLPGNLRHYQVLVIL